MPILLKKRVLLGSNNLAVTHPNILKQWDYEKNDIKPEEISYGSGKKVWWKCSKGHSYEMTVYKKLSRAASCPVCSGHKTVPGINDFATCYPEIAKEWHPNKNGDLLPSQVSKKNGRKVWWICQYGHEWQATIRDRVTDKTGCPKCRARRLTSFSEQAIYYYVKQLYPDTINRYKEIFDNGMELDIFVPSIRVGIEFDGAAWHNTEEMHLKERKKYQICQKNNIKLIRVKEHTGNEWWDVSDVTYTLHDRRNRRDLETIIQVILDWMDPVSNMWTRKRFNDFHSKVHVNIKRDENAIREYLTPIANSLAELRPDLVKDWNYEKNGNLKPTMFGINSSDYVWWKCKSCGHEWESTIQKRSNGLSCPCCDGRIVVLGKNDLKTVRPDLAEEWNYEKNGDLKPEQVFYKSDKRVWWVCKICGHVWCTTINHRYYGTGCPKYYEH